MERTIRIKTVLSYQIEKVYVALTDRKLLNKWFMENDSEPILNHEFTLQMAPQKGWHGITHFQVS
jgi:uncharacterized protein YndB with AHSA1/START domain